MENTAQMLKPHHQASIVLACFLTILGSLIWLMGIGKSNPGSGLGGIAYFFMLPYIFLIGFWFFNTAIYSIVLIMLVILKKLDSSFLQFALFQFMLMVAVGIWYLNVKGVSDIEIILLGIMCVWGILSFFYVNMSIMVSRWSKKTFGMITTMLLFITLSAILTKFFL